MPRFVRLLGTLLSTLGALGCGSNERFEPARPFADDEDVKVWATSASAVGVYAHAYESIAVADGQLDYSDPSCPATNDDGTTLTITGGCTDTGGRSWKGQATVVRSGDDQTLTFDDFGGNDGTVTVRRVDATRRSFDAELVIGEVTTIRYSGTVDGDYDGPTTWNGSGRVTREGVLPPLGSVEATTADELVDDVTCSGEPSSGSTTLHARGDTAVVTYDGAIDCDSEHSARLAVNGDDRGLVTGIVCAVKDPGRNAGGGGFGLAFALLGLALRARRRLS